MDGAVHWIDHYPADKCYPNQASYSLDSDLSSWFSKHCPLWLSNIAAWSRSNHWCNLWRNCFCKLGTTSVHYIPKSKCEMEGDLCITGDQVISHRYKKTFLWILSGHAKWKAPGITHPTVSVTCTTEAMLDLTISSRQSHNSFLVLKSAKRSVRSDPVNFKCLAMNVVV